MILIDANLLIYAYDSQSERHNKARRWVEEKLSGAEPVRFAWMTLLAFLRITTSTRILMRPLTVQKSKEVVSSWLEQPQVDILSPTERHWEIMGRMMSDGQAGGELVMDAHLAALAVEHGSVLCSCDKDFSRFDKLNWIDPLAETDKVKE